MGVMILQKKQGHQIPQRKFRTVKIQAGFLVDHKHVQKIIKQFKNKIGDHQFLDQLFQSHILFGKIAGYKNEGRHMERKNHPF